MKNEFKELIEKYGCMHLLGSDGACACGELYLFGIKIKTHCHRTTINSMIGGCKCDHAGVHIGQDFDLKLTQKELKAIAKLFADYIKEAYWCGVSIVIEKNSCFLEEEKC